MMGPTMANQLPGAGAPAAQPPDPITYLTSELRSLLDQARQGRIPPEDQLGAFVYDLLEIATEKAYAHVVAQARARAAAAAAQAASASPQPPTQAPAAPVPTASLRPLGAPVPVPAPAPAVPAGPRYAGERLVDPSAPPAAE